MDKLNIFWKFLLSFLKKDWDIEDYPLKLKIQKNVPNNSKYCYQIINWWALTGIGSTKEEAFNNLRTTFETQVKNKGYKPRPGTKQKMEVEFASCEIVNENYEILEHFIINILGFTKDDPVFISDESSLTDFSMGKKLSHYIKKINSTYGINLKGKGVYKISEILLLIKEKHD